MMRLRNLITGLTNLSRRGLTFEIHPTEGLLRGEDSWAFVREIKGERTYGYPVHIGHPETFTPVINHANILRLFRDRAVITFKKIILE